MKMPLVTHNTTIILDDDGAFIADASSRQTADELIRRCNAYDDLLLACLGLNQYLSGYCESADEDDPAHEMHKRYSEMLTALTEAP